jgi:hypothetical protein
VAVDVGKLVADTETEGYRDPLIEAGKAAKDTECALLITGRSGHLVDKLMV